MSQIRRLRIQLRDGTKIGERGTESAEAVIETCRAERDQIRLAFNG